MNTFIRRGERRSAQQQPFTEQRAQERRIGEISWIPLFKDVDADAVRLALCDCAVLEVSSEYTLLTPGKLNNTVYILLVGRMSAYLDADGSAESAIPVEAGECVGELSAIDGKPVSALVATDTRCRILEVPGEVFWERLMILPKVAKNLRIMLSERVRRSSERALKAQREQLELLHLKKELDVARQLQISMLPLQRPMLAGRTDIEVCGFMEPTTSVGGDLFDAFFVREHHMFFCIGDVSGHGIVAALFMARAIGLLRMLAQTTLHPERLLTQLNDRLCVGNETNIFVTLFCGFLDTHSGKLIYSNAGHCAPVLVRHGQTEFLPLPKGALLGAWPGLQFLAMRTTLAPGDTLFCYTDGVTEASNPQHDEFTEDRCLTLLSTLGNLSLPDLIDQVRQEVRLFTCTDSLEDDCTMLALRLPRQ